MRRLPGFTFMEISDIIYQAKCEHNHGLVESIIDEMGPVPTKNSNQYLRYYCDLHARYQFLKHFNDLLPD